MRNTAAGDGKKRQRDNDNDDDDGKRKSPKKAPTCSKCGAVKTAPRSDCPNVTCVASAEKKAEAKAAAKEASKTATAAARATAKMPRTNGKWTLMDENNLEFARGMLDRCTEHVNKLEGMKQMCTGEMLFTHSTLIPLIFSCVAF